MDDQSKRQVQLQIPLVTLVKVTGFFLLLVLIQKQWELLLLMVLGLLLAVSLEPIVERLQRWVPRWASLGFVVASVGGLILGLGALVIPPLLEQMSRVLSRAPVFLNSVVHRLPPHSSLLKMGEKLLKNPFADVETWAGHILTVGQFAIGGLSAFVLVYVFMIYFLVDGKRAYSWVLAFFGPEIRVKIRETCDEVAKIISAYIVGQVVTSVLCSIFVYVMLRLLNVPAALMLGVVAGVFDVLPIIGFILTAVPAVIFAATVSPASALIVLVSFGAYHIVENYWIVPRIYGSRLRLSGLTVLVSLLFSVEVGGLLAAIVILPVVASYAIIERIWLIHKVGDTVVKRHDAIDAAAEK